jgi:hypothetical protein
VRFVIDKVLMGQVSLPTVRSSPVSILPPVLHSHLSISNVSSSEQTTLVTPATGATLITSPLSHSYNPHPHRTQFNIITLSMRSSCAPTAVSSAISSACRHVAMPIHVLTLLSVCLPIRQFLPSLRPLIACSSTSDTFVWPPNVTPCQI